jgi:hypothetical protein
LKIFSEVDPSVEKTTTTKTTPLSQQTGKHKYKTKCKLILIVIDFLLNFMAVHCDDGGAGGAHEC